MKKIVALAITASALLAGPDIGGLVDYDAQDDYIAQTQEAEQYIPAPVAAPIVIAPAVLAPIAKRSCCPDNRDSVDLMGGYNFTEDSGALGDAATLGIRYNKNIAPNTFIQLGYDRVFNADYRNSNRALRGARSVSGDGAGSNGSGSNGAGSNGAGSNGAGSNGSGSNGSGSNVGIGGNGPHSLSLQSGGTQLDRFYLNGLYEFCSESKLTPYLFGGLGYENVRHESTDLKSGGFIDAGAGLKYQINEKFNLLTEAKGLKKFDNDDIDIVAGVGIGMMFGAISSQIAPSPEMEVIQSTPSIIPNAIPEYAPVAQVVPAPSPSYDNLDVVSIQEQGRFQTRAVFNEPSNRYANSAVVPIEEESRYNSRAVSNGANYYIQVAALFDRNAGGSSYFRQLDSAGLNHQIKQTTINGRSVKLLLVGPYNSSAAARADLSRAKSIERGAFIKKFNG